MPKTEHYQWYTEQFAPTELHAHAIEVERPFGPKEAVPARVC